MRGGVDKAALRRQTQRGSVLVFTLLVCLGVAVIVQVLTAVVLCAERALVDESVGRQRLSEQEAGLAALADVALDRWGATHWGALPGCVDSVEGCLALQAAPTDPEWVMAAMVRQTPEVSDRQTSALVERGRDGIDLPLAALVAESVCADADRTSVWLAGEASGYVHHRPDVTLVGAGCSVEPLARPWRLDEGWAAADSLTMPAGVAPSSAVIRDAGGPGHRVLMSGRTPESSVESPVLVLITGGADVDARGLGDVYGVIVVDDGSVFMDGTVIHGAVFATGTVDLGATGQVVYSEAVFRWATDRSLWRVRLVPGSRGEITD